MSRLLKINLGLLCLIAVIVVSLLLTTEQQRVSPDLRVASIDTDKVTRITVQRRNSDTLQFVRDASGWSMTAPAQASANSARINAMLYLPNAQSFLQLDGSELELQQFALQEPEVVLSLDEAMFSFGGDNPLDQRRYVLHEGVVHLVNDSLYHQLLQPPGFFLEAEE